MIKTDPLLCGHLAGPSAVPCLASVPSRSFWDLAARSPEAAPPRCLVSGTGLCTDSPCCGPTAFWKAGVNTATRFVLSHVVTHLLSPDRLWAGGSPPSPSPRPYCGSRNLSPLTPRHTQVHISVGCREQASSSLPHITPGFVFLTLHPGATKPDESSSPTDVFQPSSAQGRGEPIHSSGCLDTKEKTERAPLVNSAHFALLPEDPSLGWLGRGCSCRAGFCTATGPGPSRSTQFFSFLLKIRRKNF